MLAKQTIVSASLVVVIGGAALAEPEPTAEVGEVSPGDGRGRLQIGAGYATDDGFIAVARVEQPNLLSTGKQLAMDATLSGREQRFGIRYVDPDLLGSGLTFGVEAYNDRKQLPGFWRDGTGITASLSHRIGDHARMYVGYRVEQVEVDRASILSRGLSTPADLTIVALRTGIEYSTVDAAAIPTRGSSLGLVLEAADPRLGSDVAMSRVHAWASAHWSLGPFIIHTRQSASAVTDQEAVRSSERLYLDGSSELRGYAPGALAPGGGTYKLLDTFEIEKPLWGGLSATTFADAGIIGDVQGHDVGASFGAGLVWRSPIGPLRVDYALPMDHGPPRWVIGLGAF